MATSRDLSRGAELLEEWRAGRQQVVVCDLFGVPAETYNRFEHGKRKPNGRVAFRIEKVTDGFVPATSWYEPPTKKRERAA